MPTYVITAPNGKTLEVNGDRPPNESELKDIFSAAGVETGAPKPDARSFGQRLGDAAVDVPVGMAKQMGRYAQMIPGVAAGTDKLYGLPSGASAASMQPSNDSQKAGGYLTDLALATATGGAEAGGPIMGRSAGYVSNPTVVQRAGVAASDATRFGGQTIHAVKSALSSGGPVTPDKVAGLIVKYGKDAVRAAVIGGGGYGAWQAVKHLL